MSFGMWVVCLAVGAEVTVPTIQTFPSNSTNGSHAATIACNTSVNDSKLSILVLCYVIDQNFKCLAIFGIGYGFVLIHICFCFLSVSLIFRCILDLLQSVCGTRRFIDPICCLIGTDRTDRIATQGSTPSITPLKRTR